MADQITVATYEMPDGSQRVEIDTQGQKLHFTASELSEHIANLAAAREQLLPPVSTESPPIAGMQHVADDPTCRWAYDEMNDRFALVMRHPGFGWVGYSLPFETTEAMQTSLREIDAHRKKQRHLPN
ncbi:hypothetical protein KBK24_0121585 [Burkholderia sp. K24]|nr:hypothetical protein KBK24_0121585 [Burkholderia sp. K24]